MVEECWEFEKILKRGLTTNLNFLIIIEAQMISPIVCSFTGSVQYENFKSV
jgi:hypothetical protein